MKIAIVDYENHDIAELKGELTDRLLKEYGVKEIEFNILGENIKERPYLFGKLKEYSADFLITFNLAGFELCTLTDAVSYNLLDCKQLHWIEKKGCVNEKFLNKILSIVMFFATEDEDTKKYILENYESIPRMYLVNDKDSTNENIVCSVLKVIEEINH